MSYRVLLTAKAEADVESVLRWFRDQRATASGRRWYLRLMSRLEVLESQPEGCRLADEAQEIGQEIRKLLLGRGRYKYRLLFKVTGRTVFILRIWHSSRRAILPEEFEE